MEKELSLDHDWCIGEPAFATIETRLRSVSPRVIVEFGSGRSSIRLCRAFPQARIITVEHSQEYSRHTEALKREFGIPDEQLRIIHAPLTWQRHGFCAYLSYAPLVLDERPIDAVIVDGPPFTTRRGREACLYQIYPALRTGGIVILDDCHRKHEQAIVRNWLDVYPKSFQLIRETTGHGLAILTKTAERPRRLVTPRRWADNWQVNLNIAQRVARARLASMFL